MKKINNLFGEKYTFKLDILMVKRFLLEKYGYLMDKI